MEEGEVVDPPSPAEQSDAEDSSKHQPTARAEVLQMEAVLGGGA